MGIRLGFGIGVRRRPTAPPEQWRPYGYGTTLLLDWAVGDGADSLDFGLGGVARIHDRSSYGCHGVMVDSALLQPLVAPLGLDDKPALFFDRTIGHKLNIVGPLASALSGLNKPFEVGFYGRTEAPNTNGALLSLSHTTGTAQLQLQLPRTSGTPIKRLIARRVSDAGVALERGAQPDVTTAHRLLNVTFDGAVLGGQVGNSESTMGALTWGTTSFTSVAALTLNLAQFAGAWTGWLRRLSVWSSPIPTDARAEWNEMVSA